MAKLGFLSLLTKSASQAINSMGSEFYKRAPFFPVRLCVLVICILLFIYSIYAQIWALSFVSGWIAGVIIYYTIKEPDDDLALQADKRRKGDIDKYNRFIDVLEKGGVINEATTPELLTVEMPEANTFLIQSSQVGITFDVIRKTCEMGDDYLNYLSCDVDKLGPGLYLCHYWDISPVEALAQRKVEYIDLPTATDITYLPVGVDYLGETIALNLESRNCLIGGNPRAGKSVLLSALVSDLCTLSNERIVIFSPKILDFQNFAARCELVSNPQMMLDVLGELHNEMEKRKQYCINHHQKKIEPQDYTKVLPHIVVVVDEFAVIRGMTCDDEKGKTVKIGEQIQQAIYSLVAEGGFAAISWVLCLQKASGANGISTDLRDLISGNRICFASESKEATKMILGDLAEFAPAETIGGDAKGVGYISLDSHTPVLFRGALTTEQDEITAAKMNRKNNA